MKELVYNELLTTIEQMINDNVKLVHAGQIIEWDDTIIPEIIEKLKLDNKVDDNEIPSGTLLINKYSEQTCAVINDTNGKVSMILSGDILVYPKKWIWSHFKISNPGE